MAEGNFEARVSAKRETNAGIFLTLQVQPDDYTSDLATLRVGSALMIGWAEVVNNSVEPFELEPSPQAAGGHARAAALTPEVRSEIATKAANTRWDASKERKPFASLPMSQQAAMRTNDPLFRRFLAQKDGPSDFLVLDTEMAADEIRQSCGVISRGHIKDGEASGAKWQKLETDYQAWITTQRYASVAR